MTKRDVSAAGAGGRICANCRQSWATTWRSPRSRPQMNTARRVCNPNKARSPPPSPLPVVDHRNQIGLVEPVAREQRCRRQAAPRGPLPGERARRGRVGKNSAQVRSVGPSRKRAPRTKNCGHAHTALGTVRNHPPHTPHPPQNPPFVKKHFFMLGGRCVRV